MRKYPGRRCHNGHAERAKRNQSIFDLVAGEITGRYTANSDSQSQRHIQQRISGGLQVQEVSAINNHSGQVQSAQKPEIRIAYYRQKQRTVQVHEPDLAKEVVQKIN